MCTRYQAGKTDCLAAIEKKCLRKKSQLDKYLTLQSKNKKQIIYIQLAIGIHYENSKKIKNVCDLNL